MGFMFAIKLPSSGWQWFTMTGDGPIKPGLRSVSAITLAGNLNRTFESSGCSVAMDNSDNYWNDILAGADKNIVGAEVEISETEFGNPVFYGQVKDIGRSAPDLFVLNCDSKSHALETVINERLNKADFPSIPEQNEGQYDHIVRGYVDDAGGAASGMIVAYRVGTNSFWIGEGLTQIKCYTADGTDVTASCTYDSATGLIAYTSTDDSIYVCYSGSASFHSNPAWWLRDISPVYHGVFSNLSTSTKILQAQTWFANAGCDIVGGTTLMVKEAITFRDLYAKVCEQFDCWILPGVGANFHLDYDSYFRPAAQYVPDKTLSSGIIGDYQCWVDTSDIADRLTRMYWYHYRLDYFHRLPADVILASDWTAKAASLDMRLIKDEQLAYKFAMRNLFFRNKPHFMCSFTLPLEVVNSTLGLLSVGKIFKLNYPLGYFRDTDRILKATRMTIDEQSYSVKYECLDVTHKVSKLKDIRLMLLSHTADGDTDFLDFSPKGQHVITAAGNGSIAHSTDWKKFHKSSIQGQAGVSSAALSVPDSDDWDILAAATANFTIHVWAKTPGSLSGYKEQIVGQYIDSSNEWMLRKENLSNLLNFRINGSNNLAAAAVAASTVYHLAVCKVGDALGVYQDGVQIIFVALTGIDATFAEVLGIAGEISGASVAYGCDWLFDELTIYHENVFGAAPVVGLTDTITPPAGKVTWEGFNLYDAIVADAVPAGVIMPFDSDASIPGGWAEWSAANGKYLVAAGGAYGVGETGGDNDVSIPTDVQGAHAGTATFTTNYGGAVYHQLHVGTVSAGGHPHNITFKLLAAHRKMRFIKALNAVAKLPKDGIILATDTLTGPTNVHSGDEKYLVPGSSRSSAAAAISDIACSQAGKHTHADSEVAHAGSGDYATETLDLVGDHDHPVSALTLSTDNVKKAMVSAWTDAAADYDLEANMIAMYESLIPPAGWALCDGNNGTVDLRDYFVRIGTTVNHGTKSGDNTITVADTIDSVDWNHGHVDGAAITNTSMPWGTVKHTAEDVAHDHDLSEHSPAFVPEYYAIAFIQKL